MNNTVQQDAQKIDKVWVFFAPFFLSLLGLDQLTKAWAVQTLELGVPVNEKDFGFVLSHNEGIVLGLDLPIAATYLMTFGILALGIYLVWKNRLWEHRLHLMGFALILAGAVGNLVDRLHYGYVIDFIKVYWWPTFNLADVFIVSAVVLLCWDILFHEDALAGL